MALYSILSKYLGMCKLVATPFNDSQNINVTVLLHVVLPVLLTVQLPKNSTLVALKAALIPCVITSIPILLVSLLKDGLNVPTTVSPVASTWTSRHFKLLKVLLIDIFAGAAQNDTFGLSVPSSTMYVKLILVRRVFRPRLNNT